MFEFLDHHLAGKALLALFLILGGIAFVVSRALMSGLSKGSAALSIKAIKRNPLLAKKFGNSLDIPYSVRENFLPEYFEKLKNYMSSVSLVGKYVILHTAVYEIDRMLIFTELSFVDFDVTLTGQSSDVSKTVHLCFVLKYDRNLNQLSILSDIHSNLAEKLQKEGFVKAIFQGS